MTSAPAAGPPELSDSAHPETPLAHAAVRGGIWVALGSYWQLGFGFLAGIVLTRLLPPEDFGTLALATFFIQLLQIQNKVGLVQAFAHDRDSGGASVGTLFGLSAGAAVAGLVMMALAAPVLLALGYPGSVAMACLALAAGAVVGESSMVAGASLDKALQFRWSSVIQAIAFPLSYVPAFWLAANGGGFWSLVAQTVCYAVLLSIGSWWALWRSMPQVLRLRWTFSRELAWRYLRFGSAVGIGGLAALLVTQIDSYLVGTLVGLSALGFYDRAYHMAKWPALLLNALVGRAAFYTYARLQGDTARLSKTLTMVIWLITTSALPLAVVLFVVAPDLITFIYTDRWLPAAPLLRLLLIHAVIRPLWENAGSLFTALGQPVRLAAYGAFQAVLLAITCLPLTILWGAQGAAVAVGITFIAGVLLLYRRVLREIPIDIVESLLKPGLVALLTIAAYVALNRLSDLSQVAITTRLALKTVFTAALFGGLTFTLQPAIFRQRLGYVLDLAMPERRAAGKGTQG